MTWTMLATIGPFEYWTDTDGMDTAHGNVYRRKASHGAGMDVFGTPCGLRWESTRAHYQTWTAPKAVHNV